MSKTSIDILSFFYWVQIIFRDKIFLPFDNKSYQEIKLADYWLQILPRGSVFLSSDYKVIKGKIFFMCFAFRTLVSSRGWNSVSFSLKACPQKKNNRLPFDYKIYQNNVVYWLDRVSPNFPSFLPQILSRNKISPHWLLITDYIKI